MKLSLHFGLNRISPDVYGGWDGELAGCHNDAYAWRDLAVGRGFEEAEMFLDESATRGVFLEQLKQAAAELRSGDKLLLTYSGHGAQMADASEEDGTNETFCFFDGELVDDDFAALLATFAPGVEIAALLDCCHSGGLHRTLDRRRNRAMPRKFRERVAPPQRIICGRSMPAETPVKARVLVLAACRENEVAADGVGHGAFTESMLKTWRRWPSLTWYAWFDRCERYCRRNHPQQHPTARRLGNSLIWMSRAL
jgi:metacaspase-1